MRLLYGSVVILAALAGFVGCSAESGDDDDDGSGGTGAGGTGGAGLVGGTGPGGAAGAGGTSGCDADLTSDPQNCGSCGHSCLGGDCTDSACQPSQLHDEFIYSALATDGAHVYWRDDNNNTLMRVDTAGASAATTVADLASTGLYRLDHIEVSGSYVFLSGEDSSDQILVRVDTTNGASDVLFDDQQFGGWGGEFAVDDQALYFVDGEFLSMAHAGGSATPLTPSSSLGSYYRNDVAVDATHVYISAHGYSGQGPALFRAPKGGGNEELHSNADTGEIVGAASGGIVSLTSAWDSDACAVQSFVMTVDAAGADSTAATFTGRSSDLRADGTDGYYINACNGYTITKVAIAGGTPVPVSDDISNNANFTADDVALYFWSSSLMGLAKLAK